MQRKIIMTAALTLWLAAISAHPEVTSVNHCLPTTVSNRVELSPEHHLYVVPNTTPNKALGVFATVNDALRQAETFADDSVWTTIHIPPGVYWIDDPDDAAIRKPAPGEHTPFGLKLRLSKTRLIGMGDSPEDVVLACNRGQTQGADGNFTMLHITGDDIQAE